MAKLADARNWLEGVLGDKGRAHSLIVKGRDQELFTKGKRGGSAPDLNHSDFAALVASALTTAAPSKIGAGVREILALKLIWVEYDLGGADPNESRPWRGCWKTDNLPAEIQELLDIFPLGLEIPNSSEVTFGLSLSKLFVCPARQNGFALTDRVGLVEQDDFKSASILLHETERYTSEHDLPVRKSLRLSFSNRGQGDLSKVENTRHLYITALDELLAMTKQNSKDDSYA